MRARHDRRLRRRRSRIAGLLFPLAIGFALLWAGIWFALRSAGLPLPGIDQMWPMFPIFGGLLFYLGFLVGPRAYGVVMPGTLFFLTGLFFLPFSFGLLDWTQMEELWPVFPMILGLAFVALFLASLGRYPGLLIPAGLFVSAGVVGLSLTVTPLGSLVGVVGWPVAFLAGGATLVLFTLAAIATRVLRLLMLRA